MGRTENESMWGGRIIRDNIVELETCTESSSNVVYSMKKGNR